ncbi:MAG: PqiC family protein [Pseudomonadota bacterium]
MTGRNLSVILALTLTLAGCIGSPTRLSEFYLLSPDPGQAVAARATATAPLSVGLGPVSLPEIYDRPQIVTRTSTNQVNLAEFDRWAGDLNKELSRTLAQNLMTLLNTDSIALYPWPGRYKPDFQVSIRFFRLDGELNNAASLEGVWRLLDGSKGCELAADRFQLQEQTSGPGYPELVDAISRGIAQLSQEIAEQVAAARPGCE